jgi:hypothetical protein
VLFLQIQFPNFTDKGCIILHVFLYGCETWSPKLKYEHRPRLFESRMLKRIFGLKWNEVMGG